MNRTAVVFLADGFEDCEALLTVDLLRRAGITVITASINEDEEVTSAHDVTVIADIMADLVDFNDADIVILPGGMPGTKNLAANEIVRNACLRFAEKKYVAAICAAPSILGELGILGGKEATCYPGFEDKLLGADYCNTGVVVDGNIITGQALGSAIPFALAIIEVLLGKKDAEKVKAAIYY